MNFFALVSSIYTSTFEAVIRESSFDAAGLQESVPRSAASMNTYADCWEGFPEKSHFFPSEFRYNNEGRQGNYIFSK